MTAYLIAAAVVFGINLLPALGPPTWAVLVLFRLDQHLSAPLLIALGALAAGAGRLCLALATRRVRRWLPARRVESLRAAGNYLAQHRGRAALGLGLFALSPLPSAQLFEAAGILDVPLLPVTAAFFGGRLVSYSLYIGAAGVWRRRALAPSYVAASPRGQASPCRRGCWWRSCCSPASTGRPA